MLFGGVLHFHFRDTELRVRIKHREIQLVFLRVQIDEEVVNFVQNFRDARVGPVDLVDHDDGLQLGFERLHQNVTRLRQRAFTCIDKEHDAVNHLLRARSTSPPKSLWPGVSTMLIFVP